ncbi:MAG: flagellin [Planctomycetota bacterium]|nr:flagellin [Planctomycetota bacterium]
MSRINTNVQSMIAQRVLGQNNIMLNKSLERLSTGLRINRGKDDPSGLIASENLRAEISATSAAISNATRADQVVNTAEGGLQEISSMLTELQGLVTTSSSTGGLSQEERDANQLQIDSILQTIDRIAGATSFQGMKLLNGNFDYQVSSIDSSVTDFQVNGAKFNGTSQEIDVIVTQSAQQGILFLSFGATSLDLNSANSGNFTIELTGSNGSRELQFASGTTLSAMVSAINTFSDITGITASVASAGATTGIALVSSEFGTDEFSTVKVINEAGIQGSNTDLGLYTMEADDAGTIETTVDATFDSTSASNGVRDNGQDIGAIINGIAATTKGKDISINTDFLDVEMTLTTTASQTLAQIDAFNITGGGADFQLAPTVDIGGQVSLGIGDVAARKLGNSDTGFLDDLASGKSYNIADSDGTQAQKIVTEAIGQVSSLRGRLGAFQKNVIGATIRSLGIALENTAAAESVIRDADFAAETAALTRSQILSQASTNVLSIANNQPQAALQLLG